ncbi:MAG TPA: hypothetical protein VMJ92_02070, partial [Candidatus Limnocylindrales bacterium]|nr:hypothetical protein [Candidatus Limnocylindrales bacterium]
VRDVVRWMDEVLWQDDARGFSGSQDADEHYYALDATGRAAHSAPSVDRTLYTGWNALAASAYLAAWAATGEPVGEDALEDRAHAAIATLSTRMRGDDGAVMHFDDGSGPRVGDLLSDLAALLVAHLDAYETGLHPGALAGARAVARRMRDRLEDPEHGGFYDAPEREELGRVVRREKPIEEGALAAEGLLRLAALTGEEEWRESAIRSLRGFVGEYRQWGQFAAGYAVAVARALTEPVVVSVVGPLGDGGATDLWRVARAGDDPARGLHRLVPGRDDERLAALGYSPDRAAAYVCVGTVCSAPLASPEALRAELVRARARLERTE